LSINNLNSPNLRLDENKINYEITYGMDATKNKNNLRVAKNFQDQSNEVYSAKSSFPIFIDDLEEETILDVINFHLNFYGINNKLNFYKRNVITKSLRN
jgi:hypothetical protein